MGYIFDSKLDYKDNPICYIYSLHVCNIYNYFKYDSYSNSTYVNKNYTFKILNSEGAQSQISSSDINENYYSFENKLDLSAKYELRYIGTISNNTQEEIDLIKQ